MQMLKRIVVSSLVLGMALGLSSCQDAGLVDGLLLGVWKLKAIEFVNVAPPVSIPQDIEYVFAENPAQLIITSIFKANLPITKTVETATFITDTEAMPNTLDVLVMEECVTSSNGSETCVPILGGILNQLLLYQLLDNNNTLILYGVFGEPDVRPENFNAAEMVITLERVLP